MFVRIKSTGPYRYLQLVQNHREGRRTVQRVIATLGRADDLIADGQVDSLLKSLSKFARKVQIMGAQQAGQLEAGVGQQMGPDLVFGRLWQELQVPQFLKKLLQERKFEFPVERAVYLAVLHRLCESGSDRAAERWRRDVRIPDTEELDLHHLYRAMRWLGENKDAVEESLFEQRRNLWTDLSLAFFDTTSLYFEGQGGESLGQFGHPKDHRPDLHQMVVGAVLTQEGRPISCEMWPGNHTDSKALLPVVDRLKERFGLKQIIWVADRGMISQDVITGLEQRRLGYILGARMRKTTEVRDEVLSRGGQFKQVEDNLHVKQVWVGERRYIVCFNPDEAKKDAADREAIIKALADRLQEGAKGLVGNSGYRRFLRIEKESVSIDRQKVKVEARYDGKFVLRTNSSLPAAEVATQYKRLLLVEQFFRATKSLLETRPIFHQWDATIRGHVFCSFLALVLLDELQRRLNARGWKLEWADIRRDLEALLEIEVRQGEEWFALRTALQGVAGKVLQAVGVAIPPPLRPLPRVVPKVKAAAGSP